MRGALSGPKFFASQSASTSRSATVTSSVLTAAASGPGGAFSMASISTRHSARAYFWPGRKTWPWQRMQVFSAVSRPGPFGYISS